MNVNHIFKAYRSINVLRPILNTTKQLAVTSNVSMQCRQITRNMWCLSANSHVQKNALSNHGLNCSCGCGNRNAHSKGKKMISGYVGGHFHQSV